MGPTWVLSVPDGPHVGLMNLAIRVTDQWLFPQQSFNLEYIQRYIDNLSQEHSNSIANALETLQSCTEPSICTMFLLCHVWLWFNTVPSWYLIVSFLQRTQKRHPITHPCLNKILAFFLSYCVQYHDIFDRGILRPYSSIRRVNTSSLQA